MPTPDHPVALTGVDVAYPGGATALRNVDVSIGASEVFGVIGESGAGKSTLLSLITGEIAPTRGVVRVLGEDPAMLSAARMRALRRRIGVVFQGVHLLSGRTVRQNVGLPLVVAGGRRDRATRARHDERIDELLRFVGLESRADAYPAQLSGGQRQRVGIARALIGRPELLLCDEPTSSLDAGTTVSVLELLREARERFGTTVVVVTHDLAVVRQICDRVALFDTGSLRDVISITPGIARAGESYLDRARRELGA